MKSRVDVHVVVSVEVDDLHESVHVVEDLLRIGKDSLVADSRARVSWYLAAAGVVD